MSAYCVIDTGNISVNKTQNSCPHGVYILVGERQENKINKLRAVSEDDKYSGEKAGREDLGVRRER